MIKPAVFLDRDGTVNEQMGYINHESRFHLLPGAAGAIKKLNDAGVPVVIVTNQSGIARGYFPENLLDRVHEIMNEKLAAEGAHVDAIYICPHHPEARQKKYRRDCNCRKPKTGLFIQAAEEMELDLPNSYVVGDRWSDLESAKNCKAAGILVLTGYGRGELEYAGEVKDTQPAFVAEDLGAAVNWILQDMDRKVINQI